MNGSLLGQCSSEGGAYLCLIKDLQGSVSVSAWKDKQVECVGFVAPWDLLNNLQWCNCVRTVVIHRFHSISLLADFAVAKGLR